MNRTGYSVKEVRRQKKRHPKKRAPDLVHQLDQGCELAPGPDDDQLRCGADVYGSVLMALDARLVTCPKCLSTPWGYGTESSE